MPEVRIEPEAEVKVEIKVKVDFVIFLVPKLTFLIFVRIYKFSKLNILVCDTDIYG